MVVRASHGENVQSFLPAASRVPVRATLTVMDPAHVFQSYCSAISAGDAPAVAALFADDGYIEHPIGSERATGHEAIRARFETLIAESAPQVELTGPVRTTDAGPAAAPILSRAMLDGRPVAIDVIDVATFTDDGMIASLMGYWSADNVRPRSAAD